MKFVLRLIDRRHGALLAWAECYPRLVTQADRASCAFVAPGPTPFLIERAGEADRLVIHWCDLDLARELATSLTPVVVGQPLAFEWTEPVWTVTGGTPGLVLPAVIVRTNVVIGVPAGGLGVSSPQS